MTLQIKKISHELVKPIAADERDKKSSFKEIMDDKASSNMLSKILNSNEKDIATFQKNINKTELSPTKMINYQVQTSMALLRVHMNMKILEVSLNSIKSFTQMQV